MPTASAGVGASVSGDVYRSGNAPPANPNVAGVPLELIPDYATCHEAALASTSTNRWTHRAFAPLTADIRDGYSGGGANETALAGYDSIYIPDKSGTQFIVIFVERIGRGTAEDKLHQYLQRQGPAWPSKNI